MSEHSSDSDSSCGWTVINHEGSDIEAVAADSDSVSGPEESALEECPSPAQEENQQADFNQSDTSLARAASQIPLEPHKADHGGEKSQLLDASSCVGAGSDDSDIVTLEVPKVEEIGNPEEPALMDEKDFNMGSSSSSQYTFCQPETVFPPQPSGEESSSDETSHCSSPALRRRRAKKRLIPSSESEETLLPHEPETKQVKHLLSSGLNRCIILALVIAVSMGFGHFYGTVQIQKRQQLVEKTHEDELQDMKGDLLQCQQEHGSQAQCKSLKESLATCVLTTEMEKKSFESQRYHLASENQHLRESLQKEEKALALLQGELHKLQEHVRLLESNGPESQIFSENQELRVHLEEEKHRMQSFMKQRETLLVEAQMLRQELDQERQGAAALRETLETLSSQQESPEAEAGLHERQEIDTLRGMLTELEKKLSFEQQRSDLWEKLYIEVKGHVEKQAHVEKSWKPTGQAAARGKGKPKASFFASVKDTFDAMKNSTKEFVRHHKEKIKEAKEAVKENLKKFSDSVTSTFRHFKDSTKNIFEGREKKYGDRRHEAKRKGRTVYQADASPEKQTNPRAPGRHSTHLKGAASGGCSKGPACSRKHHAFLQGCSGIFDCAHQEFVSLFNKELDPIQAEEFNQLMHKYLQQKVRNFHHWRELEIFVNQFFRNGIFIHDQMLFSDFVSDIKDYLEDIKEYQRHSERVFEDLDKYIYQHYFHYDQLPQPGCSHPNRRPPFTSPYSPQQERQVPKHQQRHKRDVRWQKQGRANGRHTANLEIEVGRLPFNPKY